MTRKEFFNKYYNFALAATQNSGLSPLLILAQAYLESGAGKSLLATKYNNFFGVKATKNWQGKTVRLITKEQNKQGIERKEYAIFKVHQSPADSFTEQIKFLKANPRYTRAGLFTYPNNWQKQAETLQKAGYATDINYSNKLKELGARFIEIIQGAPSGLTPAIPLVLLFLLAKKFF